MTDIFLRWAIQQNENDVFQKNDLIVPQVDKALEDEDDKTEVEKMKMKAVEVELNQEKSITEEIKRKVERKQMSEPTLLSGGG